MENYRPRPLSELGPFQLVILVLSLFVLAALAIELVLELPEEVAQVFRWIDNTVCIVFLIDFGIRFHRAESKLRFMKWGWIDLLASIPEIDAFRWGRLFRVFRIIRLLRAVRSFRMILELLFRTRTSGGFASVFIITFLVLSISSVGILLTERAEDSNIKTAADAVWWSITTITTVGYGDRFPVTFAGRILAAGLMITGVGLFGTMSGVVASFFLGDEKKTHAATAEAQAEMLARLQHLESLLREQSAAAPIATSPSSPPSAPAS